MTTIEVRGTCHHDCPDSCGWLATAVDGKLISVKGNPDHPYSDGQLCPKVNRFVHRVNDDGRLLTPLIRTGAKGVGHFREATWDEALSIVVARVNAVREEHGGQAILPWWSAGTQGMIQESSLDRAFFASLGTSTITGSVCGAAAGWGMAATYGASLGADPLQAEHSDVVILWGTNTRLTNRHLWPTIEAAQRNGARVIVVDPLRTITADAADEHVQPFPGTDVAVILAMMQVLIAEDLIDHEYIKEYTLGFDELSAHVKTHTPEWAEPRCGVPAEQIRELARTYGNADAAMVRALIGAEHHQSGATIFRMLSMLPVLTGSWRVLGGGFARSVGSWSEVNDVDYSVFDQLARDAAPSAPSRREFLQAQLGQVLDEGALDPAIHALFVWNGNPLVSIPDSAAIRRGLEREDLFTVVSEQFMTDTARYADVVFPATTQVEHHDVVPSWGHLWLGWNEPAIEPMGEAVPNTEFFRRLAAAFELTSEVFEMTDLALIDLALGPDASRDDLRRDGFVRVTGFPVDHLPYANGGFRTPSGRAELVSESFVEFGVTRLPEWIPPSEGRESDAAKAFPLTLVTPKKQTRFLNTSYSGLAGHADKETGPFVELDPVDAASRGLEDGDLARVWNERGSLRLEVLISDRLRPGVASIPWGFWVNAYGPGVGSVNDLTNAAATDFGGGASYGDTLVEVAAV
jgi:anaerobic selenocysteine-containing dehydrogenase